MMHKSVHFAYSRSQQSDTVQQSNSALQGPTSRIREDYFILSERVQHDSVSTVAFKFQAHHLFHIFKFDVQEVGLGTTWQVFRSFSWILVVPF